MSGERWQGLPVWQSSIERGYKLREGAGSLWRAWFGQWGGWGELTMVAEARADLAGGVEFTGVVGLSEGVRQGDHTLGEGFIGMLGHG